MMINKPYIVKLHKKGVYVSTVGCSELDCLRALLWGYCNILRKMVKDERDWCWDYEFIDGNSYYYISIQDK